MSINEIKQAIFQGVLDALSEVYSDVTMSSWLEPLEIKCIEGNKVTLIAENNFKKNIVVSKYMNDLIIGFQRELDTDLQVEVEILSADEIRQEEERLAREEEERKQREKEEEAFNFISPSYNFETFVVGNSNKVAYEASLMATHNPAVLYNPLFIYGPSGLGKTHLLFSIYNEVKMYHKDFKVIYVTCEEFTNLMVDSLTKKMTIEFREKFRNIDFLLVDDIQFLARKNAVQEELFHTFETLYNKGKQIVFASDRPPSEINDIDKRLTFRFSSGLVVDIQPPDTELRVAIFKTKAKSLGIELPNNVLLFLAENIRTNIRQIEGALKTLKAYSFIGGEEITLPMAKRVLSEYLKKIEADSINADKIITYVAKRYSIKKEDITGNKRNAEIKDARHIAVYLMREILGLTYKEIGNNINKHYSTIMSSYDKINERVLKDPSFKAEIEGIKNELNS